MIWVSELKGDFKSYMNVKPEFLFLLAIIQ